ncbi:MAG: hypothetical protein GFH27_549279n281 [Chloroflexi bacterium AL-W]|nr:hypothetical protein [Chloroflexi bacterium AL-N1]NOK65247.1 hypothetical protein [Chloroflexi bacterium AL-N10]NOK72488.1 hypothetical protein [Chloroflexi bacterium AL-N5]NOK79426.1 hypothetical protein [Chloroflexi bacterium AL-W]NOK87342.1 hypothetical protein [Chloroflexi bacterium AL-N15]
MTYCRFIPQLSVRQRVFVMSLGILFVIVAGILLQGRVLASPEAQPVPQYSYSAKFVCGVQDNKDVEDAVVRPGVYATEINIHNYQQQTVELRKRFFLLVENNKAVGREPEFVSPAAFDAIALPPNTATMDDCRRILELTGISTDLFVGYLEIVSPVELSVNAVYTEGRETNTTIDIERVPGQPLSH